MATTLDRGKGVKYECRKDKLHLKGDSLFLGSVSTTFVPDCLDYNLKSKKYTQQSHLGKLKFRDT